MADTIGNTRLIVTDGDLKINLFDLGFQDWVPKTAPWKDGGVFSDSPFSDKTALISRQFTSTADTFTLAPNAYGQDAVIRGLLNLKKLLEKAVAYQLSRWQNEPVWIEACGEQETNIRYALITAYEMPELDNPFQPPFTTPDPESIAIEDFILAINHEIWQSERPGQSHCVLGNSLQLMNSLASSSLVVPIVSMYDAASYYNSSNSFITPPLPGGGLILGRYAFVFNNILVFRNVQLNHLDSIVTAHIDFVASANCPAGNILVTITGLKNRGGYIIMPDIYTPEQLAKLPRTNGVNVTIGGAWTINTTYQVSGLASIIQEIINDPEWEIGDDICLIMEDNATVPGVDEKFAWSLSATPLTPPAAVPQLHIDSYYSADCEMGQELTCDDIVFLANKQNRAQITDIMVHDVTPDPPYPPEWQHFETCLDALPHHLWPDVPAVGDELFVGIRTSAIHSGQFSNIIFNLSFPYSDQPTMITGLAYEYYDKVAVGWVPLPANTYYDETQMFNVAGTRGFFFLQPANMWHAVINTEDCYWILFKITAINGATHRMADQITRPVYTVNTAYFDIPEASAGGDIPAIAKSILHARLYYATQYYYSNYLAVRSLARGIDFSPYLNCTGILDQIPGLTLSLDIGNCTTIPDPAALLSGSPTGQVGYFDNPILGITRSKEFNWNFNDTLAKQYIGKYAMYLRFQQDAGIPDEFYVGLSLTWGGMVNYLTDEILLPNTGVGELYLGTIDLSMGGAPGERFNQYSISLTITASDNGGGIWVYDLVLVPVDEFPILIKSAAWTGTGLSGDGIMVDSIGYPKDLVRVIRYNFANGDLADALEYYLADMWKQQTGHQRIWYFGFGAPDTKHIHRAISLQQFASNRYSLGMRGAE